MSSADQSRAPGSRAGSVPAGPPTTDLMPAELMRVEPVPVGTRLLHIGPAKTGTTSLQSAFHLGRDTVAAQGVHYAGKGSQPRAAAGAVVTGQAMPGHRAGTDAWPDLVAEVTASTADRVVISSETFARGRKAAAARVIEAFGADRTHVVITMRPLADMLGSSWQQFVQTGTRTTYGDWLAEMLNSPNTLTGRQPQFWAKTRIDRLVRQWGKLVGFDHVTVVSLADRPREFVLRTFERLSGLQPGTLVADPGSANVSLGYGSAEVVRRFNELYESHEVGDRDLRARLVEFGAVRTMRQVPDALSSDGRIELPQWAGDRAAVIMAEINEGIRASGVSVIGDLDALVTPSRPPVPAIATPDHVSVEAATGLVFGMLTAALEQGRRRGVWAERRVGRQAAAARDRELQARPETLLDTLSTAELTRYLLRRTTNRTVRRITRERR